jgi:hypothetical protein
MLTWLMVGKPEAMAQIGSDGITSALPSSSD